MIQLQNLNLPDKLVTFRHMKHSLMHSLKCRLLSLSNMSGYPIASNVTGRLQRHFDFSSMQSLLSTSMKVRDLVKFSGDVLELIPIVQMHRYQLSRVDVGAFITNHAAAHGMESMSTEETDFVSYLMTSSESLSSNWLLEHSDSSDSNLHLKMAKLYQSLIDALSTTDMSMIKAYDADNDKVVTLADTTRGAELKSDIESKLKAKKITADYATAAYSHFICIEVVAQMRILDHMHSLFMSMAPWSLFLTPRTTAEPNTNVTRAQSLRLMAGYLHSLLLYPYHLKAELFLGLYDRIQTWLLPLPSMPSHLREQYDLTIRHTDALGAQEDAQAILTSQDFSSSEITRGSITNFFREQLRLVGLDGIDAEAATAVSKTTGFKLSDLATLGKPEYQAALLAQPIKQLTIVPSVTKALMVAEVMEQFVQMATSSIAGLSSRYHAPKVLEKLKAVNFRVPITILPSLLPTINPKEVTDGTMDMGKLHYTTNIAASTRDYDLHIQRRLVNTVFTPDQAIAQFRPKVLVNESTRLNLIKLLPKYSQMLAPSVMFPGSSSVSRDAISESTEMRRTLIETLTGMSYRLFSNACVSELYLKDLATAMSSWCLLFATDSVGGMDIYTNTDVTKTNVGDYKLVSGYGHPWGSTYKGLLDTQGTLKPEDYLPIAPGVAICLLKKVPLPTFNLTVEPNFINQHPYNFFACNSETEVVGDFVYSKPMVHLALMPPPNSAYSPAKFFLNRNYVFMNQQLYIEVNLNQIAVPAKHNDGFDSKLVKHNWSFEKYQFFADYVTGPQYGPADIATSLHSDATEASAAAAKVSDMVKAAEKKMQEMDENKPEQNVIHASDSPVKAGDLKALTPDKPESESKPNPPAPKPEKKEEKEEEKKEEEKKDEEEEKKDDKK